jgi:ABC-type Fe3+ transport system permease subunit
LFALAMALGEFAVPHVLQCRLYPIEVYGQVINYLDEAGALRLALPLLTITLLAAAGVALAESGRKYVVAVPSPPRAPVRLGRYAWTIGGLLAAYLFFTSLLPLAAMLYECRSIAYFVSAARASAQELQNTLWLGSFAALVACAAGLAVGARTSGRWRLLADILALLPLGVPPLVVGLAYLHTCHRDWPLEAALLSDTNALAVLALAVRGWPFVTRMVAAGHRRIAPEWLDAAGLAGMGRWKRWWWISRPLVSDYLAGGALVAYVFAVGDVEITQMLCAPGAGSLAVRMCTFLHFGPSHVTASLAVLNLMIALLPVLLYVLITNRSVPVR